MKFATPALRMGPLSAAIALAMAPSMAVAQESDATTLDRIEITGSRIRQANLETAQPVIALKREEIEKQGFTSVGEILQNMAAAGSPVAARADALEAGEEMGGQYVALRNLGAERTLVLLDGKRMGISSGGYTDLAAIPTSVIERVEVLTDGASAIYGSDAIAGVVNIITRKNFDGLEASVYTGQYSQGDGEKKVANFAYGQRGERGSVTFGAELSDEAEVSANDRSFSRYGYGPYHAFPNEEEGSNGWSSASDKGVLFDADDKRYVLNDGAAGTDLAGDFHAMGYGDYTNASAQMWLQTKLQRRSVFANGDYDLSDTVRATTNVLYTRRTAVQQIAGYPFQSYDWDTLLSTDSLYNPLGTDADFIRRTSEVPRQTESEQETFRFSVGLAGSFDVGSRYFDWDVGYVYNQNNGVKTGTGNLFLLNVRNAVGPSYIDPVSGVARCGTAASPIYGCTPWNPLLPYGSTAANSLGDAAVQDYLFLPTHDTYANTTKVFSANIGGAVASLPAGELMVAVGVEHREESGKYSPDALLQSGLSTNLAGGPTQGKYSLDEIYTEVSVPLLSDAAWAKELSLDLAARYSDYDTFGDTFNGKVGLKWKPTDDVLVRGTYATGFRAPTISDLYGGTNGTYDSYTDPCDTFFGSAARNAPVAAACAADGLSAEFRQKESGGILATGPGAQSVTQFESGSNPYLQPETSKTWTAGVVYSPSQVAGLDLTLDFWKIRIDDVIEAESVTSILKQCYVMNTASACERFEREEGGRYDGQVIAVTRSLINGGYQETQGYDFGLRYSLPETNYGKFVLDWKTTYVDYLSYKRDNEVETPVQQKTSWGGSFRIRSTVSLDWSYGDFGVNWGMRYYSSMKEECYFDNECNIPDFVSAYTLEQPSNKVGSNTFHDLQVRYTINESANVSIGANNVFNHVGPIMYSQPNSSFSYYGGFDIGRYLYAKFSYRF